jgi:hypothetical protein
MWTLEGWDTHDHNWSVELALDLDSLPVSFLKQLDVQVTVLDDGISFNSWWSHLNIKVGLREVLPFSTIDLECPSGGSVTAAFSTEDFKDMVSGL